MGPVHRTVRLFLFLHTSVRRYSLRFFMTKWLVTNREGLYLAGGAMVTHTSRSTNRARRWLTLLMQPTALVTVKSNWYLYFISTSSGGARVFAARGKRLCCRPLYSDRQLIFL